MGRKGKRSFSQFRDYMKWTVLYYISCIQLGTLNAYLYIRFVVKHHRRPKRIPRAEAEAMVKELYEKYKYKINRE